MSTCMSHGNKTANGFKNVFSIKETHRRMCTRLTAFQPFLFVELQHLDLELMMMIFSKVK